MSLAKEDKIKMKEKGQCTAYFQGFATIDFIINQRYNYKDRVHRQSSLSTTNNPQTMNAILKWILENPWVSIGTVLALYLYYPLCKGILAKDPAKRIEQNIATFVLWGALDAIAAITIHVNDGNYILVSAYVFGATTTSLCILKSKTKIIWTWVETMTTILVIACIVIWVYFGSEMTVIASSVAVVFAGIPQAVDAWKKPESTPVLIYVGYVIANSLSLIGGRNWSIEERYYPALCVGICLLTALCAMRKLSFKSVWASVQQTS